MSIAVLISANGPGWAQSFMTRHVREASISSQSRQAGRVPSDKIMQLDVVLPVRNRAGVQSLLKEIYNPASPNYRHYLTPSEFTERFGPTQHDFDATVRYLKDHGLEVLAGSRDSRDIQVKGPVTAIETAFHVHMLTYRHPTEDRTYYGPDREPTVDLPFPLWHVSGLDNFSVPKPRLVKLGDYAKARGVDPRSVVSHATTGSGPSKSFLGSDMRAAYYGNGSLTGAGQTVGLFEFLGTDLNDLQTYYNNIGQTLPLTPTLDSVDGTSTSCEFASGCDDGEQNLDMTQALGMAPGMSNLVMFIGSTDTAIISAMTTYSPLPVAIGCSWGWTPADPSTLDPYFEQMAIQGQTFFAASGDSSTWSASNEAWPADDVNVVSVGGTDLRTASAGGSWASETAWVDSGGGVSPDGIAIPSYQQLSGVINSSNKGSTTHRNGPDVSANANFTFYTCGDQSACQANVFGGTSFAAPMWAGYIALLDEQLADGGQSGIGFINPMLYSIGTGSTYSSNFHDITSGTSGSFSAVQGYDLVTGWGSMNGANLLNTLGGSTSQAGFSLSATDVTVAAGSSATSTVTESVTGGFNTQVTFTTTGKPSSVTSAFVPTSLSGAGTTTLTFNTVPTTPPGTYTITVHGTPSSGSAETTTLTLTVKAPASSFSLSATNVTVTAGSSATSTVTESVTGGFNTPVTFSTTGKPASVSSSFNPPSLSGAGKTTLTFNTVPTTPPGTYTITVHGTPSSGAAETTTLTLTVKAPTSGFSLSATNVTVTAGSSATSTVTESVTGGFNTPVTFSTTGKPASVTSAFVPTSLSGAGTTTLTFNTVPTTPPGTYTITVHGTPSSGAAVTTTLILTINP